ncbi:MAG: UbiH/UbiF/VisC/COQ6 family ubiquinone biosynthesis hydroxylase [Chromatiales bacterium]|nr:UbiH/UbiF/VisC/COQ6 family ubiquinone biosynthesis hydroxylase [Chromatiales bacterium]
MNRDTNHYDVIISGGGMVGVSMATALGQANIKVAVIEPHLPILEWPRAEYDIRVSAITRATEKIFNRVGAWQKMVKMRVAPYQHMQVWDESGDGSIHFDSTDLGEPNLGHIIENSVIHKALLERLHEINDQLDSIELITPAQIIELKQHEGHVDLSLDNGRELSAKLLIAADGANSWIRDQVGITTTGWLYDQSAVVATIQSSKSHRHTAWQQFMKRGPLAFLPLNQSDLSSIVWSTSHAEAARLADLSKEEFLLELHEAFGDELGEMISVDSRGAFPLQLKHANHYCSDRVVLIGNAAHAIHPLAGQGLNLGINDVAELSKLIIKAHHAQKDWGDYALLRRYERARKGENVAVMAAMDGFKRLFSNDQPLLKTVRNIGLNLADHAGPIKNQIIRQAMGLK